MPLDWTDGEDAHMAKHLGEGPDDPKPAEEDDMSAYVVRLREFLQCAGDREVPSQLIEDVRALLREYETLSEHYIETLDDLVRAREDRDQARQQHKIALQAAGHWEQIAQIYWDAMNGRAHKVRRNDPRPPDEDETPRVTVSLRDGETLADYAIRVTSERNALYEALLRADDFVTLKDPERAR